MNERSRRVAEYIKDAKAFVFDLDDTLIQSKEGLERHNMALAERFGAPKTLEQVRQLYAIANLGDMLRALCGTDDIEAILAERDRTKDNPEYALQPIAGVPEGLKSLKRLGYVTALFTAVSPDILDEKLVSVGYDKTDLFDFTDTVYSTGAQKSNPKSFTNVINQLKSRNIAPDESVYVGDGLGDMEGSLGAGMRFVAAETGYISATEFDEHGVHSLPGVTELIRIIKHRHGEL